MVLTAGVSVRPAREQDLEQVIALNRAALPENYMSEFFANLLRTYGELFLTAEIDGRIVGYVMCRIELGMPTGGAFGIIKKGHVVSLAVDKDVRRGGVGYALMQEVLRRMNGAGLKECFLEVRVNNEPAIKLYEKLGFRVVKKIAVYYSDGTDGYVMALGL